MVNVVYVTRRRPNMFRMLIMTVRPVRVGVAVDVLSGEHK